jgi:hypothetical protein
MTRKYSKKNGVNTQRHKNYVHLLETEIQQLVEEIGDMLEAQAELENRPELLEEADIWPELVHKRRPAVPPILAEFEYQIQLIRTANGRHDQRYTHSKIKPGADAFPK